MGGGEGREGDWECGGCGNRNYAFRSFCNRCKQSRLLVDSKTPADSKWLPRIGDWICTGCTNNNYASREKCKKCGQAKEVAAMPAFAMTGASLQTHPTHYFARAQGGVQDQRLNLGLLPLTSNWLLRGPELAASSTWSLGGNSSNQVIPKGWRNGDWICTCGFHNYSSRAQCKQCNAHMPPALGTKRLASDELVPDWDNKRLNAGQSYPTLEQMVRSSVSNQTTGVYSSYYPDDNSTGVQAFHLNLQTPMPTLPGKGAKQWRDGDWMCTNCNNHNYASRSHCNKCNTQREGFDPGVTVA